MVLVNKERFEIGIIKRRGEWYWKPEWCGSKSNFHKHENGKDFKFINTWSYYILTNIQLFFLCWIFYITIKPELISGNIPQKYVEFEKTHLVLFNVPEENWND